ncbi:MAG: CehA/McbA family metallohydrolase [Myxococcales bacterium]|nr:CehA/McbA family metallohydrolase [Myxococcales bacterium]MCB9523922.1 CehA/McbA family metallohydrolase [Myxococcales bacterium]
MRRMAWAVAFGLWACGEDAPVAPPVQDLAVFPDAGADGAADAGPDAAPADAAADAGPADAEAPDQGPGETARVPVDLSPYQGPGQGARAFVAQGAEDLVAGTVAQGRAGDYVLENDRVRFVVEGFSRAIGPCPWGGNVIDGAWRDGGQDVVGEVCTLLNLGITLKPERFEIVQDGAEGGAAVLAVTGRPALLDFINLPGFIASFSPVPISFGYDTDRILPLAITQWYVLSPDDTGLTVITAIRNDGAEDLHVPMSHLIDSGGSVRFFNPAGPYGGYGYRGLSLENVGNGDPFVALAFVGDEGGHAIVPAPVLPPDDVVDLPAGGAYVAVAGVAVTLTHTREVIGTLVARPNRLPSLPGLAHLAPGAVEARVHKHFVGPGQQVDALLGPAWAFLGLPTQPIQVTVSDAMAGAPGVRVTALDPAGRAFSQATTGADGTATLNVPADRAYTVRAWAPDRGAASAADVAPGGEPVALTLAPPSSLTVRVRTPAGAPTPAKITVLCQGACPNPPQAVDRDITFDGPIGGTATIEYTGPEGEVRIPLAAGDYRVVVSRGIEWSVWPADAVPDGGAPVTLAPGEAAELDAEIAHVVDSAGWLSGDFHVHSVNSPDSPVSLTDRVRNFMGEGVDVLVSTDHDFITDYAPVIEALGAGAELISLVGIELTTFDYGHFNGFPLPRDAESRNGGTFDWAGGEGPGRPPKDIFAWMNDQPGAQVVQVNHPDGGYFGAIRADVLAGTSEAPPEQFRLPPEAADPVSGLWDEGFNAMEIMNGFGQASFFGRARWWLTMVGRGFTPTGTAVSDTHNQLKDQGGGPRTFVWVGEGNDAPATFDREAFVMAVNQGRAFGSGGPVLRVTAQAGEASATLGDTLRVQPGEPFTLRVEAEVPAWMSVDTVQVIRDIPPAPPGGEADQSPLPIAVEVPLSLGEAEVVAEGTTRHARRRGVAEIPLTADADGYLVVVVRGSSVMWPVMHSRSQRPIAFTNPIYLDADGGGYDHPPLAAMAKARRSQPRVRPAARWITAEDVQAMLRHWGHDH